MSTFYSLNKAHFSRNVLMTSQTVGVCYRPPNRMTFRSGKRLIAAVIMISHEETSYSAILMFSRENCSPGAAPRALLPGRCTPGAAPRALHPGRCSPGAAPRALHRSCPPPQVRKVSMRAPAPGAHFPLRQERYESTSTTSCFK